jgi:hypothetical protein
MERLSLRSISIGDSEVEVKEDGRMMEVWWSRGKQHR